MGNIYTIPATQPFVDVVAAEMLRLHGNDPYSLASVTLLVPNRRVVRAFKEAFVRANKGRAVLLPAIMAIGDMDATDDLSSGEGGGPAMEAALPDRVPISSFRRRLMLGRLIQQWRGEHRTVSLEQDIRLAIQLSLFINEIQREECSFAALANLVPEELAEHWQITIDFLSWLDEEWKALLDAQGYSDPVDHRNKVLVSIAEKWRKTPPDAPVYVVGTTGSTPATAELLKVVLSLPEGHIVLPSLDTHMSEEHWQGIDDYHPQDSMKDLLKRLKITREEVKIFSGLPDEEANLRMKLMSEVMRSSATTHTWRSVSLPEEAFEGITRIDADTMHEEARIIALMMRGVLETPEKTAALVTHDRTLARLVIAMLGKWGIDIDDSAGRSVVKTPPIVFLRLLLEMLETRCAPVSLLALFKHPYAAAGLSTRQCRDFIRQVEAYALRGLRVSDGLAGVMETIAASDIEESQKKALTGWLAQVERMIAPLIEALARKKHDLRELLDLLLQVAGGLASTDEESGESRLWQGDMGEQVYAMLNELQQASEGFGEVETYGFLKLFEVLLMGVVYRPRYGGHPRLAILSPMEARLQQYDTVILGGLNQGSWPPEDISIWMSQPMRKEFGLPSSQKKTGLSAHDFYALACVKNVVMTRSEKSGSTPQIPCAWLLRYDAIAAKHGVQSQGADKWRRWAVLLDQPDSFTSIMPPAPNPPLQARPTQLSVTQIEKLLRDPYMIYASAILRLRPMDALDETPTLQAFGSMVHEVMERFMEGCGDGRYNKHRDDLLTCGKEVFTALKHHPSALEIWWPRFEQMAGSIITGEQERDGHIARIALESRGEMAWVIDSQAFLLTGRADRIEADHDGAVTIIDYKTGTLPSGTEVASGLAPQLVLEALMVRHGGFDDMPADTPVTLAYWKLAPPAGEDAGVEMRIFTPREVDKLVSEAEEGLRGLITLFYQEGTPYYALPNLRLQPDYNDYLHLSRMKEWSNVVY